MNDRYFDMLKAAYESGLSIEPVDLYEDVSDEQRDIQMAKKVESLVSDDPQARVLVYMGALHVSKKTRYMGGLLAGQLKEDYFSVQWESGFGRDYIVKALFGHKLKNSLLVLPNLFDPANIIGSLPESQIHFGVTSQIRDSHDALVYTPWLMIERYPIGPEDFEKLLDDKNQGAAPSYISQPLILKYDIKHLKIGGDEEKESGGSSSTTSARLAAAPQSPQRSADVLVADAQPPREAEIKGARLAQKRGKGIEERGETLRVELP
jgi:hypothetical protein